MKKIINTTALLLATFVSFGVAASSSVHLDSANTDITDKKSLQNGAKLFMNYCSGCHSLGLMRYNRFVEDLEIPEKDVAENLMFSGEKTGDLIKSTISEKGASKWFGATPPDLSLVSRYKGTDWIYTFLRGFYKDESRPYGVNNHIFDSVSMPDILWQLKENKSEQEFNGEVRDIVNFLDYVGEPAKLVRSAIGTKVVGFLLVLLILAYLLKKEYWKDVKYGKWRVKG